MLVLQRFKLIGMTPFLDENVHRNQAAANVLNIFGGTEQITEPGPDRAKITHLGQRSLNGWMSG